MMQEEHEKREVMYMHDLQEQPTQYSNIGSRKKHNSFIQRLGILVMVFFLVVLMSSIAIVFSSLRHNNGGSISTGAPGASHETATPATPTPSPVLVDGPLGKIVYNTKISPMNGPDVFALGWSPDSKRIGVETMSAQSWDAATGRHVVSYGAVRSASIIAITWSPDGQRVAVTAVDQGVQIYDALSGALLTTYSGERREWRWSYNLVS
jgi:WD40 repeat protein